METLLGLQTINKNKLALIIKSRKLRLQMHKSQKIKRKFNRKDNKVFIRPPKVPDGSLHKSVQ